MDAAREQHKLNADREMRQILEAREKEAHHLASIKKAAYDEGLAEGKADTALKMYKLGINISLIVEATGLSELELRELLKLQPDEIKQ